MGKKQLLAAAFVAALSLTACARPQPQGAQQSPEPAAQQKATKSDTARTAENALKKGVEKMRSQMEQLRVAINANDAASAQKYAKSLDEAWESFEDRVKAKDKDLYEKTEEPLNAVLAGVKKTPLDKKTVNDQLDKLDAQLDQVAGKQKADKAPKTVDMKTGVAAMRHNLDDLKAAAAAGDTAKAQQAAKDADETWEKFEDAVKAKDKAAYDKIEDPLHAILAGVKQSPLDAKALNEQITKLDGLLADLVK